MTPRPLTHRVATALALALLGTAGLDGCSEEFEAPDAASPDTRGPDASSPDALGPDDARIDAADADGLSTDTPSPDATPFTPTTVTVTLDASGGTLLHPAGLTLTVPEGALTGPTTLTIEDLLPAASELGSPLSRAFAITPADLDLAAPLSVTVAADPALLATNPGYRCIALARPGLPSSLPDTTFDGETRLSADLTATGTVSTLAVINPLRITAPKSLPDLVTDEAYGPVPLVAEGGTPPYTFTLVRALPATPAGLALSSSGALSGTPSSPTVATLALTVGVSDATGHLAERTWRVKHLPARARAHLRVGHLVPDGPPLDFCLAPANAPFTSPWLASRSAPPLTHPSMSAYLELPPGTPHRLRLVTSSSCDTPAPGTTDLELPALSTGDWLTATPLGSLATSLRWFTAFDHGHDTAPPRVHGEGGATGPMRLRFVHAAPAHGPIDFGLHGGDAFLPRLEALPFATLPSAAHVAGDGPTTDPLGYYDSLAWAAPHAIRAADEDLDLAVYQPDTWSLVTAWLVADPAGPHDPDDPTDPSRPALGVLSCRDFFAPNPAAHRSDCLTWTVNQLNPVRVVHLAPSAAAVDLCVESRGLRNPDSAPFLARQGHPAGLAFGQETRPLRLQSSSWDWDLHFIPAGGSCADTPLVSYIYQTYADRLILLDSSEAPFAIAYKGDSGPLTPGSGHLVLHHLVAGGGGIDLWLVPPTGPATRLVQNNTHNRWSNLWTAVDPGTFSLRVQPAFVNQTLATVPEVSLAAGERLAALWYPGLGGDRLALCPTLEESAPVAVIDCRP